MPTAPTGGDPVADEPQIGQGRAPAQRSRSRTTRNGPRADPADAAMKPAGLTRDPGPPK